MHNREPGGLPQPGKPGAGGGDKVPGVSKITLLDEIELILRDATFEHEFTLSYPELVAVRNELKRLYGIERKYRLDFET
jgi:hypothetical protein